jgi:hypothetical protein
MLLKTLRIAAGLVLALAMIAPAAQADQRDQASRFTFDRPIEIPGQVLSAGTYWFVLHPDSANRHIVQIFDAERASLRATLIAVSAERTDGSENTELQFVDQPRNQLKLVGWFYPDRLVGHEFVYDWQHGNKYAQEDVISVMARPSREGLLTARR